MHRPLSFQQIAQLRAYLKRGGVVAYPTESCYGLGALPDNVRGLRTLLRLKKRPQHKGMIVIGANWSQLQPHLCRLPCDVRCCVTSHMACAQNGAVASEANGVAQYAR